MISKQSHIDELVQERRDSIADAMELRLSGINPSTYSAAYKHLYSIFKTINIQKQSSERSVEMNDSEKKQPRW